MFGAVITSVMLVTSGNVVASAVGDPPGTADEKPLAQAARDSDADGVLDAPERSLARATAKAVGKPVEDLSQRSETASVVANPDGSFTRTESNDPVRMLRDRQWVDIDYTLAKQADGSWAPKASPVDIRIDGGSSNEAARVTSDDGESIAVTWADPLPQPRIEGGVAIYQLSDSTDLLIAVTDDGVNAHIRLNEAPGDEDTAFRLGLRAEGVGIKESPSGLSFVNQAGEDIGGTSKLVAWDASTDAAGDPEHIVPLDSALESHKAVGGVSKHALSLSTPDGFLNDPKTKYPVIIDPDISLGMARDTWVRSGTAAQGSDYRLIVGKINGDSNTNPARSYLQFDTSALKDKFVHSAQLNLWQYYAYTCSAKQMAAHAVASDWNAEVTWANKPSANDTIPGVYTSLNRGAAGGTGACARGWTSIDVTDITSRWVDSPSLNRGLRLMATTETQSSFERRFCSGNPDASQTVCNSANFKPQIVVNYSDITDSVNLSARVVYDSQTDAGSKPLAPGEGRAVQVNGILGVPMTGTDGVRVRVTAKNAAASGRLLINPSATNQSAGFWLDFDPGSTAISPDVWMPTETASIYVKQNIGSASVDFSVEVMGYTKIRGWDADGAMFETVTTFADGSSVIVPEGGGKSVVSASGVQVSGDLTPPVPVEGASDFEAPDTVLSSPEPEVASDAESDPVQEPAATSLSGVETVNARPLTTTSVGSAVAVPDGYKYRGGRRVNNYLYRSDWQEVELRWVDSKTRRVIKVVGRVKVRMSEKLNGGSSRSWKVGVDLKYVEGPPYNAQFEVWCGIDRNLRTDITCDDVDDAARRYFGPIWVVDESVGDDSYGVWIQFGSNSGALDKKRYPMVRNKISWDGYNLKGVTKFRGFNIAYKQISEMEAGGEYRLSGSHNG